MKYIQGQSRTQTSLFPLSLDEALETDNEEQNTYTCPQGHVLTTNDTWHKSKSGSIFQQYKTRNCKTCQVRERCTKSEKNGKIVQRRQYAENIEANRTRIEQDPDTYKKRQAIVEHPFGTIKRQWGFSFVTTKKYLHRASADIGFMMLAYNLRRIMNILGKDAVRAYLANAINTMLSNLFEAIWNQIRHLQYCRLFGRQFSFILQIAYIYSKKSTNYGGF